MTSTYFGTNLRRFTTCSGFDPGLPTKYLSVGWNTTVKHEIHIRNRRHDPTTEIKIKKIGVFKHALHIHYAIDYPFSYVGIDIFFVVENISHIGHL